MFGKGGKTREIWGQTREIWVTPYQCPPPPSLSAAPKAPKSQELTPNQSPVKENRRLPQNSALLPQNAPNLLLKTLQPHFRFSLGGKQRLRGVGMRDHAPLPVTNHALDGETRVAFI